MDIPAKYDGFEWERGHDPDVFYVRFRLAGKLIAQGTAEPASLADLAAGISSCSMTPDPVNPLSSTNSI